jgi:hypothetical protein
MSTETSTLILGLITGVASSFVASILFLYCMFRMRPNVRISSCIARQTDTEGTFYAFKIVNRTRRPVVDVHAELSILQPRGVHGGIVWWSTRLSLVKPHVFEIGRWSLTDSSADYAFRFVTEEPLHEKWRDNKDCVRLTIVASDSLTGFRKTFKKTYHCLSDIKDGAHKFGPELDVV